MSVEMAGLVCSRIRSGSSSIRYVSNYAFQPDLSFLLTPSNRTLIINNLVKRTGKTNEEAEQVYGSMVKAKETVVKDPTSQNRALLVEAASKFPNMTHPAVMDLDQPREVYRSDKWVPKFDTQVLPHARPFEEVTKALGYPVRTSFTGQIATEKSYFLYNQIAELEQALVRYVIVSAFSGPTAF